MSLVEWSSVALMRESPLCNCLQEVKFRFFFRFVFWLVEFCFFFGGEFFCGNILRSGLDCEEDS